MSPDPRKGHHRQGCGGVSLSTMRPDIAAGAIAAVATVAADH